MPATDRSLAEYARERRLYLPSSAIPPLVKEAFISAEDKNFYTHSGVDPEGIVRAVIVLVQGGEARAGRLDHHPAGRQELLALTNERSFERKIREALLAFRIEAAYSKDKILELYLNEILSRPRQLRRRRRGAELLRQIGQRADDRGSRLSRRPAEGAEQLSPLSEPRTRRSSGAIR